MLIGKVARRTLLPGQAIPTNAIGEPRLVTTGAMVRLVFEEDGLMIVTYASALQGGGAGDVISVRNLESGLTISGIVRADGSIHVGGS
jgi:flagella basal body P-ring formation protein FlgA